MKIWPFLMMAIVSLSVMNCGDDGGNAELVGPALDSENPPAPGLSTFTLDHDGQRRGYVLYIPSGYDGTTAAPVLLNFHGNGGNAVDFQRETAMTAIADEAGLILVYPQGALLDGGSHWNPLPLGNGNKSSTDDLGFINALLDALAAALNVDEGRIYACGYSNGGFMAYGLACRLSDRIAAIGDVSGTMLGGNEACMPTHPVPLITLHGTQDGVVPFEGAPGFPASDDVVSYWATHNGITNDPTTTQFEAGGMTVERNLYEGGRNGSAVVRYTINGGDHVWFEMSFEGSSTGRLIWDFVSQYTLSALTQP